MSALEITSASKIIGIQKSFFKHEIENFFRPFGTISPLEKGAMFKEKPNQERILRVFSKKINKLGHRISKKGSGLFHALCQTHLSLRKDPFKLLKVVRF